MDASINLQEHWQCALCDNTKFTDKSYYDKHMGTKKHKRNLRTARKAFFERGNSKSVSIEGDLPSPTVRNGTSIDDTLKLSDLTGLSDYQGAREVYQQARDKHFDSQYTGYVSAATAYWSVNLARNPTVQDFKITVNDKNWGDFGNAVVEIQFRDLPEKPAVRTRCAVHFKQFISNSMNVKILDSFGEGSKFSFEGFAKTISKIKGKDAQDIQATRFYVFTTSVPDPALDTALTLSCCRGCRIPTVLCACPMTAHGSLSDSDELIQVFAATLSNRRHNMLNTSGDNETVYRYFSKNNTYTLPQINIYSCQKNLTDFPNGIEDLISDTFGGHRSTPMIARDFIKYLDNWSKGNCGGFYKLAKDDVLIKLGQLLLAPYRVTPKVMSIKKDPPNCYAIWTQAIKSADITVLKPTSELHKLLTPFNLLIQKELSLEINTRYDYDAVKLERTKEKDDIRKVQIPILRAYLIEETLRGMVNDVPLEKVYLMFWKAGLMPLVMQVNEEIEQDYVFKVVSYLKYFGLIRRYLVKINGHGDVVQKSVGTLKHPLTFFVHLSDISDKLGPNLMEAVLIRVTENMSISLAAIETVDKFFKRTVSASEFFDMSLENVFFRTYIGTLKDGESTKLVLQSDVMSRLRQEVEARSTVNRVLERQHTSRMNGLAGNYLHGVNPDLFFS